MINVMDIVMGRKELKNDECLDVTQLPDRKPTLAEFETHVKKKYGIELY